MNKLYQKRFEELYKQLTELENSKTRSYSNITSSEEDYIDDELLLNWKVKVRNLLSKVCGVDSQHFIQFEENEYRSYSTSFENFKRLKAVFLAAKEDFQGGYLSSMRTLVQAEIFDSELEQAEELLKGGYHVAAAVISGIVLETTLKELCDRESISHGNLDKMNADLAKAGIYNKSVQKRNTALAGIRNSAAHGKPEEFTREDVSDMIRDVEKFLANHLAD